MTAIEGLALEVADSADVSASQLFLKAIGVEDRVAVRASETASSGFRGFIASLVCAQPANVDAYVEAAVAAGASVLKPATKSFWGYGAVVQAPDGVVWKFASSSKKDTSPAELVHDSFVLLLGVEDVKASKKLYAEKGLEVAKSFGGKYAEFATSPVTLALYPRKAAAKEAGLPLDGSGSHRLVLQGGLGGLTDPDGFVWESR